MRLPRAEQRKHARHGEAVILFVVNGIVFAIAATAVDEIRNSNGLQPLAASPLPAARLAKVRHRLERDGRTYFVVDAAYHFHLLPMPLPRLLLLRDRPVAVMVERIDRMAEISAVLPLPRAFTGEERRWYRGLALLPGERHDVRVVPVVKPEAFLSDSDVDVLGRVLRGREVPA
ncbi:MAG: chemotaxis protein CheW [Terriglobales bacterium]